MVLGSETTRPRDQWAGTVFTTWVVVGLFLDGWAHNAGKPENFWTPWHAVLYSGFLVGAGWFVVERWRRRRVGESEAADPLTVAGFMLFGLAGVADGVWHTLFGVEEDVAALLSPTHLALMAAGLLLVAGPLRAARNLDAPERTWATFAPVAVAIALCIAVVTFFLQFVSPFHVLHPEIYPASSVGDASGAVRGITGILLTNILFLGALAWTLTRWRQPPAGTFTILLGAPALLMASLLAFDHVALVAAPIVGGMTADVLVSRGHSRRTVLLLVPAVTWTAWFAVFHAVWRIGWEVEIWTGAIVLAVLSGAGLELLAPVRVRPHGRTATVGSQLSATTAPPDGPADADLSVL